jgi:hypothetical protein
MSWVEAFGLYGVDTSTPGVADYARGAIIQYRVAQGASNNAIQRELSANRLGISVGQLDPMIRAERARQNAASSAAELGVDYNSGTILPGQPPANWTGQYVHQVTLTYRTRNANGDYELGWRTMGVKAGVALTPMAATGSVLDMMDETSDMPDTLKLPPTASVLTTQLTGVWYDTARGATSSVIQGDA